MRKQPFFCLLFFLLIAIFLISCSLSRIENTPGRVEIIRNMDETAHVEQGIDAVPDKNAVIVQWKQNSDGSTVEYRVYRAAVRAENFELISIEKDTTYLDESVEIHKRYFYYVTAVSSNSDEGETSDTLSYMLLDKAVCITPSETGGQVPVFQWQDPNQEDRNFLRLIDENTQSCVWSYLLEHEYEYVKEVQYNIDGTAGLDSLQKGGEYAWRIDVLGSNRNSGSESAWTIFNVE